MQLGSTLAGHRGLLVKPQVQRTLFGNLQQERGCWVLVSWMLDVMQEML